MVLRVFTWLGQFGLCLLVFLLLGLCVSLVLWLVYSHRGVQAGDWVRGWFATTIVSVIVCAGGIGAWNMFLEDDRPMTVQIDSGFDRDIQLRLRGTFEGKPASHRSPVVSFDGSPNETTVNVPAGEGVLVRVSLNVTSGIWDILRGQAITGDLRGTVQIEPLTPVETLKFEDIPLSVHVKSLW